MLGLLSALLLAQADCAIALEPYDGGVRLRPACPVSRQRTHETVSQAIAKASSNEVRLAFGRIVDYPWLLRKPAAELPLAQGAPVAPRALLPFDAILWVTLRKP